MSAKSMNEVRAMFDPDTNTVGIFINNQLAAITMGPDSFAVAMKAAYQTITEVESQPRTTINPENN